MMTIDFEKFELLCEKYSENERNSEFSGINTYNEKRLHRIIKELACEDISCHEVPCGSYVADVYDGDDIYEIQTGGLYALREKIGYYLANTDARVSVIKPIIASKRIIRAERESGEVLRVRKSPKKVLPAKIFEDIYGLSEHLKNERLRIVLLYISADEYRYSDEVRRYNKKGKYDAELFPRELLHKEEYCGARDYEYLISDMPESFFASDFALARGFSGRALYSTLNLLVALSLLEREKQGKKYLYRKIG